jgi:hypothetical protein
MNIQETVCHNNRIGLTATIVDKNDKSLAEQIKQFFERLKQPFVFPLQPRFKKDHIQLMNFDTIENMNKLIFVVEQITQGVPEIRTRSGWERGVIYNVCKLFGLRIQRIYTRGRILRGCDYYLPKNGRYDFDCCGCDFAPKQFHKYHSHNNYEDSISYSYMPYTFKEGVRIFYPQLPSNEFNKFNNKKTFEM